jgi:hypothetical protein
MASTTGTDQYTASEWTQHNMMSDLFQQKWVWIGLGAAAGVAWLLSRRSAPEEQAARRLVRDWRHVDDADDVRDLLGSNVPTILKPVLLMALNQLEDLVHDCFDRAEHEINRL